MTPAIRVEDLGKRYLIAPGRTTAGYRTLRETLAERAGRAWDRARGVADAAGRAGAFWALRGVDFEVEPGEVVGIIGHNGAGKSTLLKILARITGPTTGRVELDGRVGSLLEVGTGFHPELTGRENVFLGGSILGMRRREIAAKFDRIVEFAGTGAFLDTPTKRYSSGMSVRLAFSIAAHLEPEILLVDEALAVGDAIFQRRCIDRMGELARGGCTLLFVSHNLELIPRLCGRAVLLGGGRVARIGPAGEVVDAYLAGLLEVSGGDDLVHRPRSGDGRARFERLTLLDEAGRPSACLRSGRDLRCRIDVRSGEEVRGASLAIVIKSPQGSRIVTSWTDEVGRPFDLAAGLQSFECHFRDLRIRPGRQVALGLWMSDGREIDVLDVARVVDVVEDRPVGYSHRADQGPYLCDYSWSKIA